MSITTKVTHRRVVIIGAGYVGSSIAYALTITNLARKIILIDVDEQKAIGESLDIHHGIPYMGVSKVRSGKYEDCRDSDLIIVTAGRNRRVGETRLDMTFDNIGIIRDVASKIKPYYNHGPIIIVSNPVDILTWECDRIMGLPNGHVFGTGCILDTSRLIRDMGAHIISAKGKTHYGIATCVCSLADAVLNQRLTIAPVTSPLQGEYGIEGVSLSVPSIIGVNGVEQRLEEHWSEHEYEMLKKSAAQVQAAIRSVTE